MKTAHWKRWKPTPHPRWSLRTARSPTPPTGTTSLTGSSATATHLVIAPLNPLRGVASDSAHLASILARLDCRSGCGDRGVAGRGRAVETADGNRFVQLLDVAGIGRPGSAGHTRCRTLRSRRDSPAAPSSRSSTDWPASSPRLGSRGGQRRYILAVNEHTTSHVRVLSNTAVLPPRNS